MDDSQLQEQFLAEMLALTRANAVLPLTFTPGNAFMLLSLLQLALRHPALPGTPTGEYGRTLAEQIESRVCRTPAMKEVARRGWESGYDTAPATERRPGGDTAAPSPSERGNDGKGNEAGAGGAEAQTEADAGKQTARRAGKQGARHGE